MEDRKKGRQKKRKTEKTEDRKEGRQKRHRNEGRKKRQKIGTTEKKNWQNREYEE